MIPAVFLGDAEPVAAGKSALDARGEALRLLPQLDPGEIISARIEAKLPDGSFRVTVAGQAMRMALPANVAAEDTLELTFVTLDPRPTFALQQRLPQAVGAPLLSAAGRLVAAIMTLRFGEPAMVTAASAAPPLLAALPADGVGLSASLQHTLAQSGLFYEAHQAEWLAGKHDLAQLRGEPQARFAQNAPQALLAPAQDTLANSRAATGPSSAAGVQRAEQLMPPQGVPLVQQQLAALESGKLLLQIEVWPRQWMQWQIEERKQDAPGEADAPSNWHTRLRLVLPQLGELNAALTLGGNGLQIKLDTASPASAALLREQRGSLHAALAGAGVLPGSIAIACHEQP